MKIILATRNPSKRAQIAEIFRGTTIEVLSLDDAGIQGEAVEDGETLAANAEKKARYAFERSRSWVMSDDTGLFIDALNGKPGVHTAYWAGHGKSEVETMNFCLEQMKGKTNRLATFATVVSIFSPEGVEHRFQASVAGRILEAPRGVIQPKMPYSAIFELAYNKKTWAEMTIDEENGVSHRGKAFSQAKVFLLSVI